ncbi:MAG: Pycsar system effector family protein [Mucilaginibacter sp.]|uniref:Pycsar system effector family protein n=1 Tax=Mucilaginibacter sp. TaxID=1882438 RepID=UPI003264764C
MNYQQLLQQVQDHVLNYYKTHDDSKLIYHNLQHTNGVVAAGTEIANHYQLSDSDFFIVISACWFHDTGYFEDPKNHERKGAELAAELLKTLGVDEESITKVKACIMATQMPQSASTLLEQIVCDADLFHLGTDAFSEKDKLMRKEVNACHNMDLSKEGWHQKTIKFLQDHQYYTEYCKLLLSGKQAKNLADVQKKINKKEDKEIKETKEEVSQDIVKDTIVVNNPDQQIKTEKKKNKDKNKDRPEKGIETMFRISSSNHQRLSDMADRKAHIMITVNSIILSAIISLVLRKISEYGFLIIPSIILLTVSVLAITFSILSTRPTIPKGVFTREEVDNKQVNLLFFGNFYKMPLDDFSYGMRAMMEDSDFLYGSLIKDEYSQGVVLGRKYQLLRIAYSIFMFGLIAAVLAFIIAAVIANHAAPATKA